MTKAEKTLKDIERHLKESNVKMTATLNAWKEMLNRWEGKTKKVP